MYGRRNRSRDITSRLFRCHRTSWMLWCNSLHHLRVVLGHYKATRYRMPGDRDNRRHLVRNKESKKYGEEFLPPLLSFPAPALSKQAFNWLTTRRRSFSTRISQTYRSIASTENSIVLLQLRHCRSHSHWFMCTPFLCT